MAPAEVRAACAASLARLGIDRIDLYQLHWPDPFGTPIEDTWETMCELQDAGLVRYLGVSNFTRFGRSCSQRTATRALELAINLILPTGDVISL